MIQPPSIFPTYPHSGESGCFLSDEEQNRLTDGVKFGEDDVGGSVEVRGSGGEVADVVVVEIEGGRSGLAGDDQQGVGCHQLQPGVDSPLELGLPVGVVDLGESQPALQCEPGVLSGPAQHLQRELPHSHVVHLSLQSHLLVVLSASSPASLHSDDLLGVLVDLLQGGLDPGLCLSDVVAVLVVTGGHLQQSGEQ